MVFKYTDIKNKTSEELTKTLAEHIENNGGNVSIDFLADEIKRKESKESNAVMLKYTRWITIMTAIMLLSTIVILIISVM